MWPSSRHTASGKSLCYTLPVITAAMTQHAKALYLFPTKALAQDQVRAYRGGYLPKERRAAEREMRAGTIDGIVSTSALELGVDIGSLDVVVLNGYPGSVAATWQRFGRAGRRQQSALGGWWPVPIRSINTSCAMRSSSRARRRNMPASSPTIR